jgi:tetratricopeptide (TPR) repeat protein
LAFVPSVRAEPSDRRAEPEEYRAAIERGLEEYQLENFQEARDQFQRAHALYPNARTLRGLGLTAFELRNYVEAESYLASALEAPTKPLEGKLRDETIAMLERARSYVGGVVLHLTPKNAAVSIDGIRGTQTADMLRLDIGDHVLEFHAEGFLAERRAVRVQGGQTETLEVALSRLPAAGGDSAPDQKAAAGPPLYKRWWLWTAVGLVVAGAATGLAIGLSNKHETEYRGVPSEQTPDGVGIEALWAR